ncbi:hypothetical protein [Abyssalbus ytuae]|uniref:Uncharacterized protein n=1 Tax=Abyssalbus ytuae TaxID=2926907 RepID=A0A9E6ZMS7_9FLAO|nr:hypothetical protein [Abyssalbus ytuae]UOB17569.1 hypothetical protein MQE35_17750 [Abyssalbus ytuae]
MSGLTLQELLKVKMDLKARKEEFDKYRISNGHVSKADVLKVTKNKKTSAEQNTVKKKEETSGDVVSAVKTYTEKIKNGYFGKKTRRI